MIGWLIILCALILIGVIFALLNEYGDFDLFYFEFLTMFAIAIWFVLVFFISIALIIYPLTLNKEVIKFENMQEVVEQTQDSEDELNYGLNNSIVLLNEWLASARASKELYGIFSFYNGKIDHLDYIKVEQKGEID